MSAQRFFNQCRCKTVHDVARVRVDPTGTERIRTSLYTALAIRWRQLGVMVRAGIIDQDILGLKPTALASAIQATLPNGSTKVQFFQSWIDRLMQTMIVEGDWSEIRKWITQAYDDGARHATNMLEQGSGHYSIPRAERIELVLSLVRVELQGICEAISQKAVRSVANGLMNKTQVMKIYRQVSTTLEAVGSVRTKTMVELMIVKTFADASLDVYEAAGLEEVGLVAESTEGRPKSRASDAKILALDLRRRTGPGSRVPRTQTPSLRTIQRIKKVEREFEQGSKWVNVETAEDDKVCALCDSIASSGPYKINAARSLIPAHPYCRCIFIPARKPKDR